MTHGRRRDQVAVGALYRRIARFRCPICESPERVLIDLSLQQGGSLAWVAKKYGLSRGRLRAHQAHGEMGGR